MSSLQRYSDFAPTGFDAAGAFLDDRQDWGVAPVSQTRDSGSLDASNYASALAGFEAIDPGGDDYEEHRFGHWGPGWFEIIIVRPGSACASLAEDFAGALADYPVLDDDDLSRREWEDAERSWDDWGAGAFTAAILDSWGGRFPGEECELFETPVDDEDAALWTVFMAHDGTFETHSDGPYFDVEGAAAAVTRDELRHALGGVIFAAGDGAEIPEVRADWPADPGQQTMFGGA